MNASVSLPTTQLTPEQLDRLGEVLDELLVAAESGRTPDVEAACQREPDLSSAIRHYVRSIQLLHNAASYGRLSSHGDAGASINLTTPTQRELGDYRLIREVGRGGMGIVYEAQQLSLARRVALKILPFAAVLDSRQITRFQNEAQAAASLHHPHIVPVFAVGNDRGTHYYSMQYIDGQSLDFVIDQMRHGRDSSLLGLHVGLNAEQWQLSHRNAPTQAASASREDKSNGLPLTDNYPVNQPATTSGPELVHPELANASTVRGQANASTVNTVRSRDYVRRVAELGMQAADALQHAHQHGIIHRDIKPSNLMLDGTGKLWITDFGLAQCTTPGNASSAARRNLTRSGDFLGTLRYMSPEQAAGKSHLVDHRSDIYALAATLYELLTLQSVVQSNDRLTMLRQIECEAPAALRRANSAVSVDLENIILKALSKSREDRYHTAGDFATDLGRYLSGQPPLAKRPSWLDRAARFVRQHSRAVALATGSLSVGLCACGIAAVVLQSKNAEIVTAQGQAERHLLAANAAVYQFGPTQVRRLELLPGSEAIRAELAQQALTYFQSFAAYAQNNQSMASDVAHAHMVCGDLELQLGHADQAGEHFQKAVGLLKQLHSSTNSDELATKLLLCRNNLAVAQARAGKLEDARKELENALVSVVKINSASEATNRDESLKCAMLLHLNLGSVYSELREVRSAELEFAESIALGGTLSGAASTMAAASSTTSTSTSTSISTQLADEVTSLLAAALLEAGQLPGIEAVQSRKLLELALQTSRQFADSHPADPLAQHDHCLSRLALGAHLLTGRNPSAARIQFEQATSDLRKLAANHPAVLQFNLDLASALNNLGQVELAMDAFDPAEAAFEEARAQLTRELAITDDYRVASNLGGIYNNLAMVKEVQGQKSLAEQYLKQAIHYQEQALQKSPGSAQCSEFLAEHRAQLSRLLREHAPIDQASEVVPTAVN